MLDPGNVDRRDHNGEGVNLAEIVCLHAKTEVERFCRKNPLLHVYALGDLDDFFWPHTTFYALREGEEIRQLALFYADLTMRMATVLAYAEQPTELMRDLLRGLLPLWPRKFYAHFAESMVDVFADNYRVQTHGTYHKMGLTNRSCLDQVDASEAGALSMSDLEDLRVLYAAGYPDTWFVPRMLETGFYYGVRRGAGLASVAGVHVYSPHYKVAALGNITTHPDARGQGLATVVTARLCQELLRAGIDDIGLNVRADNRSAVACYEKIGFEWVADYAEHTLETK